MENKTTTTTTTCHGGGGGGGDDPDPFLHLPEDSLSQILAQLPIKSLLRFKSVCKSWRALIQTSYLIDLHANSSSSSNFGSFIFRMGNFTKEDEILMLSEYEGSEYRGSKYGDYWYKCTDGSWHKFTTSGSWRKFTASGEGGDWFWDNTNCGWYWVRDGSSSGDHHWNNPDCGWYWISDHRLGGGHGGNWYWDNTNCGWYWVSDVGNRLWDDIDGRWYYQDKLFKVDDDDDDQLLLKVDSLELPSKLIRSIYVVIAGSCNGLICLHDQNLKVVYLWNPVTRQFRILPKSITIEIDDGQSGVDFVAFGFDVKTKDYKVLLITKRASKPKKFYQVQVYSLSTDSWRLFEDINSPWAQPTEHHGLYLNGSCFFMANVYHPETNINNWFINSFDFTNEIFTTIQLPDHDYRHKLFLSCLGGEKMALFTTLRKTSSGEYKDHNDEHDVYADCDIWVLNEQGSCGDGVNKESWTKLHSFPIKNSNASKPIGISNNGKFAFLEPLDNDYSTEIQLYNLVTKEVTLYIPFCGRMSKVYVYKPSLVSIIGGNGYSRIIDPRDKMIGGAM